jgi:addiction module RelE/StbE family toxin
MVEIVITESAYADLNDIEEYIALDSPRYARLWVEKILAQIEQLYVFPLSGKVVDEFQMESVRELVFRGYRIVYNVPSPERIEIVRVINGAKQLK